MIHIGREDHGRAIMAATNAGFSKVTMEVISREENGELYGGVVYENYTGAGGTILAHIAGFKPNWINRDLLYIIFDYPFKQLDCKQALVQVAAKNTASLNFCHSVGFTDYVVLEDVFPDDDMILLRMKRDECRFLNVKPRTVFSRRNSDGQAKSTSRAGL